ncbi:MAG TPA: hypothetical protein VJ777_01715 [Mycobacterium sp.]|nr:hypothetical protein [Mycobacterium sp.]
MRCALEICCGTVQVFATLAAFVDVGEDAVVDEVERRFGLLQGQPTGPAGMYSANPAAAAV